MGRLRGGISVLGHPLDREGEIIHRLRCAADLHGLLFGAGAHPVRGHQDLRRGMPDLAGHVPRMGDELGQAVDHEVEGVSHGAQGVSGHFRLCGEVALGGGAHDGQEAHDLVLHLVPVRLALDKALEALDGLVQCFAELAQFVARHDLGRLGQFATAQRFSHFHEIAHRRDDPVGEKERHNGKDAEKNDAHGHDGREQIVDLLFKQRDVQPYVDRAEGAARHRRGYVNDLMHRAPEGDRQLFSSEGGAGGQRVGCLELGGKCACLERGYEHLAPAVPHEDIQYVGLADGLAQDELQAVHIGGPERLGRPDTQAVGKDHGLVQRLVYQGPVDLVGDERKDRRSEEGGHAQDHDDDLGPDADPVEELMGQILQNLHASYSLCLPRRVGYTTTAAEPPDLFWAVWSFTQA